MRTLIIEKDADLKALSKNLLKADLSPAQAKTALAALQAANPHVDLNDLRANTVLFVPDAPSFNIAASNSVLGGAVDDFQELARAAITQAALNLTASQKARACERADITAALRQSTDQETALRCIPPKDPELQQQISEAAKTLDEDERQAKIAEQTFAAASEGALSKLAQLGERKREPAGRAPIIE